MDVAKLIKFVALAWLVATATVLTSCADEGEVVVDWTPAPATPSPVATRTPTPPPPTPPEPTATPVPLASTVRWDGRDRYLHGVNLPWINWSCDFGCGAENGVSSERVNAEAEAALEMAAAHGMHVVRWWMFPGDPGQFVVDESGSPVRLKKAVYRDIDAALRLADEFNIYYVFVLFSAPSELPIEWLRDESQREALAAVVGDLAERYRDNARVMAWEVFSEPEWDIWGRLVSRTDVFETVRLIGEQIHDRSPALVTVGSARIDGLTMWPGAGLDFYQAHWYDAMDAWNCARCDSAATIAQRYQLDKPVVIGEFYAGRETDALERYRDLHGLGYAGAWAWSLLPDRTGDQLDVDLDAAREFAGLPEPEERSR